MAKPGKRKGKPAHKTYVSENRNLKHKQLKVLKSSHGKWTYEGLKEHQQQIETKRKPKREKK